MFQISLRKMQKGRAALRHCRSTADSRRDRGRKREGSRELPAAESRSLKPDDPAVRRKEVPKAGRYLKEEKDLTS